MLIRDINKESPIEIEVVATRMRQTLMEVLGDERGSALYSMDWLVQRVQFHLDSSQCTGKVFVAESTPGHIIGHCIVRCERDDDGKPFGLFSTTFVLPEYRKQGVAESFLKAGEAWMKDQGLTSAATDTSIANIKLIRLYEKFGYKVIFSNHEMLRLSKSLP